MARQGERIAGRAPARGRGGGARPGKRWQPVVGTQLEKRVAGSRPLRLPKLQAPAINFRWRRAAVLAVIAVAGFVGGVWLYNSPLLAIRHVSVEGNTVLSSQAVEGVAGLKGDRLFQPDFAGAREQLLAVPVVKEVEISHDWPWGAHITIVERVPWGIWQAGQQRSVIDAEGVVLDLPPPAGAPVIVQTDPLAAPLSAGDAVDPGAAAVAQELVATAQQTLGRTVSGLEYSQTSGLTVVLDGGLRALFGDAEGYDFKVAALYAILQQAQAEGKTLHLVDLRFGNRVATQ